MTTVDADAILRSRNDLIFSGLDHTNPEAVAIAVYANTLSLSPSMGEAKEEYTRAMALAKRQYATVKEGRDSNLYARIDTFAKIINDLMGGSYSNATKALATKIVDHQYAITTSIENLTRRKGETADEMYARLSDEAVEKITDLKRHPPQFADWTRLG
jgi:hypothetical protein